MSGADERALPRALRRVGHKGADHLVPGNTLASFDAALEHDVDMVEFDVLPERTDGTGRLLLAHDYVDLERRRGEVLTLEEGLDHVARETWGAIELDVDLKLPGYEDRVVHALAQRGLTDRALVSTMELASLRRLRELDPALRLGWSVPKVRRDYLAHPATKALAVAGVAVLRRHLPRRVAAAIRAGAVDAVMAHWSVVTPRMAAAVADAGGELYVWTVDDAARIAELEALGVTGVITNDPSLFGPR
ncbi:glycerophosphodiester phosphodiesterase [Conexibacter sp. SYSU D00693]|uniref:glycerophosphodiester phosphodiesterase n=1 Tax=Conexibacter sp. SYSU D00693 TaxID=2812560 RepID=UPI00196ACF9D|nr:glycerophosphodiester phosphodiesterase [Conexibacter sp. SYSU D00693]